MASQGTILHFVGFNRSADAFSNASNVFLTFTRSCSDEMRMATSSAKTKMCCGGRNTESCSSNGLVHAEKIDPLSGHPCGTPVSMLKVASRPCIVGRPTHVLDGAYIRDIASLYPFGSLIAAVALTNSLLIDGNAAEKSKRTIAGDVQSISLWRRRVACGRCGWDAALGVGVVAAGVLVVVALGWRDAPAGEVRKRLRSGLVW